MYVRGLQKVTNGIISPMSSQVRATEQLSVPTVAMCEVSFRVKLPDKADSILSIASDADVHASGLVLPGS